MPYGVNESHNVVEHSWSPSSPIKLGDQYLYHDEIAQRMTGRSFNVAGAVSMAGPRFSIFMGHLARLERALVQYFLDFHSSRGYTEISVPYLVSRSTLEGTGQLPKFESDLFKISNHKVGTKEEDVFLIPTAEVPVTGMYRGELLSDLQQPIKHVCYTPCFRAESMSYGRDTRGFIRQHQFHKVELVKICAPSESEQEHLNMVRDVEELLESLELPYRRLLLCSADIGFSARICNDLEVWMPGQQCYREVSSISNCYEFQARRLGIRYRHSANSNQKSIPHTINGSGLAIGRSMNYNLKFNFDKCSFITFFFNARILAAILENFQNNGEVKLPSPLHRYMQDVTTLRYNAA